MNTPATPTAFRPRSVLLLAFNKSIQQEWEHQVISSWQPSPDHQPTPEQQSILSFVSPIGLGFPQSLMMIARAGSGKTNTCFRCLRTIPNAWPETATTVARWGPKKGQQVQYCPSVLTSHALGLRTWRDKFPRIEISSYKSFRIAKDQGWDKKTCPILDQPLSSLALPLVDKAKVWGIGTSPRSLQEDTPENWEMLAEHFNLPTSPQVVEAARRILQESVVRAKKPHNLVVKIRGRNQTRKGVVELDFADMIYMPILYSGIFPEYDLVVADEYQDFSPLRAEEIARCLSKKGRLLGAGDPFQAIYGFTGASPDALPQAISRFSMETRPLTWSFRCARSIIAEAQQIVPDISATPWAPEGTVQQGQQLLPQGASEIPISALPRTILCPLNAPLASLALALLRARQPVRILGRESFLRDIMPLLESIQSSSPRMSISLFLPALQLEVQRRQAKAPKSAHQLSDRARTLRALAQGAVEAYGPVATVTHIKELIESLWVSEKEDSSSPPGFTLSTMHKSKGLEWDSVGLLEQSKIGVFAKSDWEQEAATNLSYVAITRARSHLVLNIPLASIEGVEEEQEPGPVEQVPVAPAPVKQPPPVPEFDFDPFT